MEEKGIVPIPARLGLAWGGSLWHRCWHSTMCTCICNSSEAARRAEDLDKGPKCKRGRAQRPRCGGWSDQGACIARQTWRALQEADAQMCVYMIGRPGEMGATPSHGVWWCLWRVSGKSWCGVRKGGGVQELEAPSYDWRLKPERPLSAPEVVLFQPTRVFLIISPGNYKHKIQSGEHPLASVWCIKRKDKNLPECASWGSAGCLGQEGGEKEEIEFAGMNEQDGSRFLSDSLPPPAPRILLFNRRVLSYGQKAGMNILGYT